ncbi:hypothetical protein ACVILJ_006615 [Bradyrhizobium diazoefficiens]
MTLPRGGAIGDPGLSPRLAGCDRSRGVVDGHRRRCAEQAQAGKHGHHEQAERGRKTAGRAGRGNRNIGEARDGDEPDHRDIDGEHRQPQPAPPHHQIHAPGLDRLDRGRERQHQGHDRKDLAAALGQSRPSRPTERQRKSKGDDGQPQGAMPPPEHEIVVKRRAGP